METTTMKLISGGVCAAKGFKANGIHVGVRKSKSGKKDVALIYSEVPAHAAAVYTTNLVKGAPLKVTKRHLADGIAQAVICNSGNANTCNANGIEVAEEMSDLVGRELGINPHDVVVASTGVIGQPLDISPIRNNIHTLAAGLTADAAGSGDAAQAIMTTDTVKKEFAVQFELDGKVCTLGGIGKGSGMIHPNMATMLVFLTTDAAISADLLRTALGMDVRKTFNMLSVDGDTSTNDMVVLMANGLAGNTYPTAYSITLRMHKGENYHFDWEVSLIEWVQRSMGQVGEIAARVMSFIGGESITAPRPPQDARESAGVRRSAGEPAGPIRRIRTMPKHRLVCIEFSAAEAKDCMSLKHGRRRSPLGGAGGAGGKNTGKSTGKFKHGRRISMRGGRERVRGVFPCAGTGGRLYWPP